MTPANPPVRRDWVRPAPGADGETTLDVAFGGQTVKVPVRSPGRPSVRR